MKLAQFCGVVGLGERVLEVLPKTQAARPEVEACRGVLLRLLRHAGILSTVEHQSAGQHLRHAPLLETFIATFFDEVGMLVRGGLLRQYQQHEDDLRLVRGRIDSTRQLGVHANRPDLVACVFDELTADNPWNRVLKKAIRVTRPWIVSAPLHRQWVELMGVFDVVDDEGMLAGEVGRLTFDRRADRYRSAVQWARWILDLLAPSLRAGQNEAPALLFDMNKLFEQAVANVIRKRARYAGALHVEAQDRSQHFGSIVSAGRVDPGARLRPDLVFRRDGRVVAIGDTKWKLLACDAQRRPVPSDADLYQMHAYSAAFGCNELVLIHPWHDGLAGAVAATFRLPGSGVRPSIGMACVDVQDDAMPLRLGRWPWEAQELVSH